MDKQIERKKYSAEIIAVGKQLYLDQHTASSISEKTGIEINSVAYYVKTQWKPERDLMVKKAEAEHSKSSRLAAMTDRGIDILERALNSLTAADTIEPANMKVVADIVLKLKQIQKLDNQEEKTASEKVKPASAEEIKMLVNSDPFAQGN